MNNQIKLNEYEELAQLIKKECVKTAIEAYETASQNGICHEGAWECAVDSMKSMKVDEIINSFLNNSNH
ncbi:MAG: hypothetical protein M1480_11780 [Bacteroidetes bacterium]|nr:hypothetical protein [Bacteroidota bacterium]